ncbi:DUF4142 domain-containing protein [Arachidicoccus sp.]|uniref:DUF4142 domain-containing protein n=1 Tax=Arachidicoccus sp. TaxID=1872624 RepID=UPI003D2612B4
MKNTNFYSKWNNSKSLLHRVGNFLANHHTIKMLFSILIIGTLASCGNGTRNNKDAVDSAKSENKMKRQDSTIALTKDETNFMVKAANGGMAEVKMGKLANDKSSNDQIKNFGSQMVKDHDSVNNQLKALAVQFNVTLPADIDQDEQDNFNKLNDKSGNDFNKDYIDLMVKEHKDAVDLFQKEQKNGTNQTLLDFVNNALPTLQGHLQSAESIQKSMK